MDGFRERMAGRAERNSEYGSSDRYDRSSRRTASAYQQPEGVKLEEIIGAIDQSNAKQLEIIADYFDDEKADRESSEKELIRAMDDLIRTVEDKTKRPANNVIETPVLRSNSNFDSSVKEELINAIKGNGALINTMRQEMHAAFEEQAIRENQAYQQREAKDQAEREARARRDQLEREAREEREKAEREARATRDQLEREAREARERAEKVAMEEVYEEAPQANSETLAELKAALDEVYKNLEDHVHKENVRCYRNVQAALTEQNTSISNTVKSNVAFVKIFSIITMVISLMNLVLIIARILGLL